MQWPKNNVAFLIIHGIGEQRPFETLDAFTSTCWNVLEEANPGSFIPGSHKIRPREGWTENYISLTPNQHDSPSIDFYEYYWSYKVRDQVTLGDVVQWLIDTSDGAQKFYAENAELSRKYETMGVDAFRKGRFRDRWYLKHLGLFMRILSLFPKIVPVRITKWLAWILRPIERKAVHFIGDIVAYTTTDIRSKFYDLRENILKGAVDELRMLLTDERYGGIVVVGHSLGTVIAYDALNRINHEMNLGAVPPALHKKVFGLVTFGSPLDKIAFFFREHTPDDQYLRRQILTHFHSFKARPLTEQSNPKELSDPFKHYLESVRWINFWDIEDKISGQLDFYRVDENILLDMGKHLAGAHSAYWEFTPMYTKIIQTYL